jgi:hypothetical protein
MATVYVPIENDPRQSGGPIRRAPPNSVFVDEPGYVYRTPLAVVPDAEPGGAYESFLYDMKFLPDGRLVSQTDRPNEFAGFWWPESEFGKAAVVAALGLGLTGAVVGAAGAKRGRKALQGSVGALGGILLGALTALSQRKG